MSNSSNVTAAKDCTQPSVSADGPPKRRAWDFTPADGPPKPGDGGDIKSAHLARQHERLLQECSAYCRSTSQPCRMKKVPGKKRCRLHGGLSTGPTTSKGRARIAESNRRRARNQAQNRVQNHAVAPPTAETHPAPPQSTSPQSTSPQSTSPQSALQRRHLILAEIERRQRQHARRNAHANAHEPAA
jgi:hypothetical protein